jgi:hypothetical protein
MVTTIETASPGITDTIDNVEAGLDDESGRIEIRVDGQMGVGKALSHEAIFGGKVLAISIPKNRGLPVIRHFQERMLYGLFVPEVP